jgi:hypothetical protein
MTSTDVQALALAKVGRILGPARARALIQAFLDQQGKDQQGKNQQDKPALRTTADLHAFGESLGALGGIEQAVGAMLMVQAVLIESADTHDKP